jgi:hypothetical protein
VKRVQLYGTLGDKVEKTSCQYIQCKMCHVPAMNSVWDLTRINVPFPYSPLARSQAQGQLSLETPPTVRHSDAIKRHKNTCLRRVTFFRVNDMIVVEGS